MVRMLPGKQCGPIGIDIGSRSVKLLQFDAARARIHESSRWDLPPELPGNADRRDQRLTEALCRAREGRNFRGRDAVFCLGAGNLFAQNIRVAKAEGDELAKIVHFEAAGRLPFSSEEAEVRYIEADDVRQGDAIRREVILLACHRPAIDRMIGVAENAGLKPTAIDVEPLALLRCYGRQFRRDADQQARVMFVEAGASNTIAVVARGTDTMFVKYIDIGGKHFDEAVSRHLKMTPGDSAALRRHNADRPKEQRDAEIDRGVAEALRSPMEKLAHELSLCIRYYSVTFRGQPLDRIVLGGGEANEELAKWLTARLDLPCGLGNPLRPFEGNDITGRPGMWDVATGLAMKETN